MSIPCPVNISIDVTAGMLTHDVLDPLPVPEPTPFLSFEMFATQWWPPGYALGQNVLTTTVFHRFPALPGWICLDAHDQGAFILDLTIGHLPNLLYPMPNWPFSSRFMIFQASTVVMEGNPTSCAVLPIFPMLTCGDPIMAPTAWPLTNLANTLIVGMSPMDLLMGFAMIAVNVAFDSLFEFFPVKRMLYGTTVKVMQKKAGKQLDDLTPTSWLGKHAQAWAQKRAKDAAADKAQAAANKQARKVFQEAASDPAKKASLLQDRAWKELMDAGLDPSAALALARDIRADDVLGAKLWREFLEESNLVQKHSDKALKAWWDGLTSNWKPIAPPLLKHAITKSKINKLLAKGVLDEADAKLLKELRDQLPKLWKDYGWGVANWVTKTGVKGSAGLAVSTLADNPTFRIKFFGTSPPPYLWGTVVFDVDDGDVTGSLAAGPASTDFHDVYRSNLLA